MKGRPKSKNPIRNMAVSVPAHIIDLMDSKLLNKSAVVTMLLEKHFAEDIKQLLSKESE